MKLKFSISACVASFAAAVMAADGTWLSTNAGGDWDVAENWVGGVIPDEGGRATLAFPDQAGYVVVTGATARTLSELRISSGLPLGTSTNVGFRGPSLTFEPGGRIVRDGGCVEFAANLVTTMGDLTVSGRGRTIFAAPQNIGGKLRVENQGWVRVAGDASLGSTSAELIPDAITLDGGVLQNGSTTPAVLAATRGITLTEQGGVFTAGYPSPSALTILGPVTGPGGVNISYENSPVRLGSPANDWRGDTNVGTTECDPDIRSEWFSLLLGADEVIPHGEGRGVLNLAPLPTGDRNRKTAPIDLDGHRETVNAVNASADGVVRSTTPGGVLATCGAQDMDFRGRILAGAAVELRGTGRMDLSAYSANVAGTLGVYSGALDFAAGAFAQTGRLVYGGGAAKVVARVNETNSALTYASEFVGALDLRADLELTVAAAAEPFVFGGSLTTDEAAPHALTVRTETGSPLFVGGSSPSASAVVGAPIACASGLVATNYVWLRRALPEGTVVAPGTTFTYDYPDAFAEGMTLGANDLRVTSEGLGDGVITVPTGRRVIFSTQTVAADGTLVDPADGVRTYANPVVLQGGTLEFDGAGKVVFTGAVSGYGTIRTSGTGEVVLGNGQSLESGCTIDIQRGAFRLPAGGSLGAATVMTHEGRFGNVAGESIEVPNPVVANSGGIEVAGDEAVVTLTGGVEYRSNISKWGEGTLRIGGEQEAEFMMHVRGGTLALAKEDVAVYIVGCESGSVVRVEAERAVPSKSFIYLNGGCLDLNGHDLELNDLQMREPGSRVLNGAARPVTLTVAESRDQEVFGEISGALTLVKTGTGAWDFSRATLANTGMRVTGGEVAFAAPTNACASMIRFTATKARPAPSGDPTHGNSGIQFAEFRLLRNGAVVPWPDGTTATAAGPAAGSKEDASMAIDGRVSTKWYYAGGVNSPLTITCPTPVEFNAYQLVTANDAIGRDPVCWKVEIGTGTAEDGTTEWMLLDEQVDQEDVVPTSRNTAVPACGVAGSQPRVALPEGYALDVQAPATATFENAGDVLRALSGTGGLIARGRVAPTIAAGSTFTGSVSAEAPVALAFDSAEIPGITGAGAGATFVNDGVAGALTFADAGGVFTCAALRDGTAPLGLAVSGATTLIAAGAGGDHTGPTTVGAGATLISGAEVVARYVRFTPLKNTAGLERRNVQLSELQLTRGGERLPWPEGSIAETTGSGEYKGEGPMQLLDNDVGTKCYWNEAT
ncbi:MAG: hypothetical protein ACI4RA_09795, partial [Kiritimatiellia bacterium]